MFSAIIYMGKALQSLSGSSKRPTLCLAAAYLTSLFLNTFTNRLFPRTMRFSEIKLLL